MENSLTNPFRQFDKQMKIALCQPPVEDFYFTPERSYPLGLTHVAGAIRDLPVTVKILDFLSGGHRQTISPPVNFKAVLPHFKPDKSPVRIFQQYYHFGTSWDDIRHYFSANTYDIVAISSNFYTYSEETLTVARIAKAQNPQTLILVGGQNTTTADQLIRQEPAVDIILFGEGEKTFREFVLALLNSNDLTSVKNIAFRNGDNWQITLKESSQEYPAFPPDTSDLEPNNYRIQGKRARMLSTTRGCPVNCSFCSIPGFWGRKLRQESIEAIVAALDSALAEDIRVIDIEDDNFTLNRPYAIRLLSNIQKKYGSQFDFYAMNGLMAYTLDDELLELMAATGFKMVNISLTTIKPDTLANMKRPGQAAAFRRVSEKAHSLGMKVVGYFIAGLPGESIEDVIQTMAFLAALPLILGISPFYYIPGIKQSGIRHLPIYVKDARLTRFFPTDDTWDELKLITMFRLSRWINYAKELLTRLSIPSARFTDLPGLTGDTIIRTLVEEGKIVGIDPLNRNYFHNTDAEVMRTFLNIFRDLDLFAG